MPEVQGPPSGCITPADAAISHAPAPCADERAAPRFDVQPYRSKCGVPFAGTLLLFSFMALGGTLVGSIAFLLFRWYVFAFTALVMGLLLALFGFASLRLVKVRSSWVGAVAGTWGACVATLTLYFCLYVQALDQVSRTVPGMKVQPSLAGFLHYMDTWAQKGAAVVVDRARGEAPTRLGYTNSYLLWAVEFMMIAGVASVLTFWIARRPYCPRCNSWKKRRTIGYLTCPGTELTAALKEGCLGALARCHPDMHNGDHRLSLYSCANCGRRQLIDLYLEQMRDAKGNPGLREAAFISYPGDALLILEGMFA
jgi:hypothetical protein